MPDPKSIVQAVIISMLDKTSGNLFDIAIFVNELKSLFTKFERLRAIDQGINSCTLTTTFSANTKYEICIFFKINGLKD